MELQNNQNDVLKKTSYHVFQILETQKKSDYNKYQKNMAELQYNVDILQEYGVFKSRIPGKNTSKKARTVSRKRTRILKNNNSFNPENIENSSKSLEKLIKRHYFIKKKEDKKENEKAANNNTNQKVKKIQSTNIYTNKFQHSLLKKYKTHNINILQSERKMNEDNNNTKDKDEIFITNLINPENNDINSSNNGFNRYSEYIRNIERYSNINYLPPIKNKSSFGKKPFNLKTVALRNNTLNNLNEKKSFLDKLINEEEETIDNKKKENFLTYAKTESYSKNSKSGKVLKINEDIVLNMIKNNKKFVSEIRNIKNNLEKANLDFETKFKYVNWKYGIADMNKYFIDIKAYRKNEEDLINKRKTFYDRLDDMVDDIKKAKKMKNISNIAKQFGIKIKDADDNKIKEIEESDKILSKNQEVKNSIKELYKRRKNEKLKRGKIKDILDRCRNKFNHIRTKLDQYKNKDKKLKEIE